MSRSRRRPFSDPRSRPALPPVSWSGDSAPVAAEGPSPLSDSPRPPLDSPRSTLPVSGGPQPLIDREWLAAARRVPFEDGPWSLGVDVARSGRDRTAFVLLRGNTLAHIEEHRGWDTMATVARTKYFWDTLHPRIAIDVAGVGAGVVDRLRQLGVPVHAVNFASRPSSPGSR